MKATFLSGKQELGTLDLSGTSCRLAGA
jgi:hypothetical protein